MLMLAYLALALATVFLGAQYFVKLRKSRREYDKAKSVIEDIVFSFNRQLRQEAKKVEAIAYRVEAVSSSAGDTVDGLGELKTEVDTMKKTLAASSQSMEPLLERLISLERKEREIAASHDGLLSRIAALESKVAQPPLLPDIGFEAPIPIKREKALAQLTDTEISVLELLISEGSKTAPEIKDRVKLSREHTARLMKKLYEGGYLERETAKIPFRYTVKKEMERFLKKAESEPM